MRPALLMLFILSWWPSAYAQRTVRNGGGLAELNVIYFHQNLIKITNPCLAITNPCRLTTIESGELQTLAINHQVEIETTQILFTTTLSDDVLIKTEHKIGADITFNQGYLYNELNLPKAIPELSTLILAARLIHISKRADSELFEFAQRLANSIGNDKKTFVIQSDIPQIFLHSFSFQQQNQKLALLVLEDHKKSIDLSQKLQMILNTQNLHSFVVENVRSYLREDHFTILFEIVDSTDLTQNRFTVKIKFKKNTESLILTDTINVELL